MTRDRVRIRPLPVGGEVVDLEPGSWSDPAIASALYSAWIEHGLLLFRDVNSIEEHLALSAVFGEPELHPLAGSRDPEEPFVMSLGDGLGPSYVYDGVDLRRGRLPWHRDGGYLSDVTKGGMLRFLVVPERDGETLFADTAKAFDELPADVKEEIGRLEFTAGFRGDWDTTGYPGTLWSSARFATPEESPENERLVAEWQDNVAAACELPAVVHPTIAQHPESGRMCIFLSPKDFHRFLRVSEDESESMFQYLVDHMTQDRYVYKHSWTVNDAIVWDNRRLMHAASGYFVDDHRRGQRTTLSGAFHSGRLFDPIADAEL
jgi:taurine dioxygenase